MEMSHKRSVGKGDVDGGWAWVILLASFGYNLILVGTLRTLGVLHIEFKELFDQGDTLTGLISFFWNISMTLTSVVAGMMADRYRPRGIVMVAGFVGAFSVGVTSVAPTLTVAIITMGVLAGGAVAFVAITTVLTLNKCFEARRAFANGVSLTGASVGGLLLPPIIRAAVDQFALRGTLILLSGLWLHCVVVGATLRPLKFRHQTGNASSDHHGDNNELQNLEPHRKPTEEDPKPQETEVLPNAGDTTGDDHELQDVESLRTNAEEDHQPQETETLLNVGDTTGASEEEDAGHKTLTGGTTTNHGRKELFNGERTKQLVKDGSQCDEDIGVESSRKFSGGNCSLLCNWEFVRLLVVVGCGALAQFNNLYSLPLVAAELGETRFRGSLLLTISGTADLVSRIVFGYIADFPSVSRKLIVKLSFIVTGLAGLVLSSVPSYISMGAFAIFLGSLGPNLLALLPQLTLDIVGKDQLGAGLGITVIPMGLSSAVGSPLIGLMKEATDSYFPGMKLFCAVYIVGALVYSLDGDLIDCYNKVTSSVSRCRKNHKDSPGQSESNTASV